MTIRHDRNEEAEEDAAHRRRMTLMRMQGDLNRRERRNAILLAIAVLLGIIALFGAL
jgi:hypothetical protein